MRRCAIPLILLLAPAVCWAGEAAPETPRSGRAAPPKKVSAVDLVAEEERWVYTPPIGRIDVFVDLEALLQLERQEQDKIRGERLRATQRTGPNPTGEQPSNDVEKLVSWAGAEDARIRLLVGERRYDEAMKAADAALKPLEPHIARPEVAKIVVSIRTYRAQAEEAKLRDDAQKAFESLRIRVLGVLWSQDGARMAIVEGENRALSVNDRVKDCVVINIDQDRVDFRFNYVKRRFEFPVYVDQSSTKP